MQIQEFKYIYDDLRQQTKQIPHLQQMLRLSEKSIKKLQCINLYSITDKRDFDLQIQQQQIMKQIVKLYQMIVKMSRQGLSQGNVYQISGKIQEIKDKNIQTFDLLNKQEELLAKQIQLVEYYLQQQQPLENQIKQQDQFDQQYMKDSNNTTSTSNIQKIANLKKQIDQIGHKLAKINHGRGKWLLSDHNDFIKIYNKCAGNSKKIIEEGIKILGMKNTQIMDHLELYEGFLQFEKEKKIVAEEYRQIKLLEKIEEDEKKQKQKASQQQRKKLKKQKEVQQNQKKKQLIQKFKQKKLQQKAKMLEQQQKKQKQKIIKIPLPPSKKKQTIERNQKYITQKQNTFKKTHEQKNIVQGKASVSMGKPKPRQKQKSVDVNNKNIIKDKKQQNG